MIKNYLRGCAADRLERLSIPEPNSGCWLFTGCVNDDGYGRFFYKGKYPGAHRAAYEIHCKPIPAGMQVLHRCDNPPCVNPGHLFLGTADDNMQDMYAKKRYPTKQSAAKRAKLDPSKAFEIRWHDAIGARHKDIAAMYGVTRPLISAICRNEAWRQECHD